MQRRRYLALAGAAVAPLAGCLDSSSTGNETGPAGDDSGETGTDSDNRTDGSRGANGTEDTDSDSTVHEGYETTAVAVRSPDGETLGSVTAAIADTGSLRYLGLSDTEDLPEDRGMLFVYGSAGQRTFVMREMDFGIDIVYADTGGTITTVHHAPAPGPGEDGEDQTYPGRGQYVLEVNYDWTTDRGITAGDVLSFDLPG